MKMAAEIITPLQVVFFRVLFGFIPVLIYAYFSKNLRLEHIKHMQHFLVMSLLATTVYYYGFVKGTMLLPSGIAGVVSGSIPIFSFLLAILFLKDEKITKLKIMGLIIGFLGVLLIARPTGEVLNTTNLKGVSYIVLGAICLGAAFVYAKKYLVPLKIHASALTTYQLGFALIVLTIFTDFTGINTIWLHTHESIGLILGLGILGTGLAYIIYYYLVETLGPVVASSVTYIPPIVALFIGVILFDESIQPLDYVATLLIFAGVFLAKIK
jgi:drug/metabolite transporter (DMT)-like permease